MFDSKILSDLKIAITNLGSWMFVLELILFQQRD